VYPRDSLCQGREQMTSMEDMYVYDNMHAIGYISPGMLYNCVYFPLSRNSLIQEKAAQPEASEACQPTKARTEMQKP
jgi:hypothetical protein